MSEVSAGGWPNVATEAREWVVDAAQAAHVDIFTRMRIEKPYQAAVLAPIATAMPAPSLDTATLLEAATVEIATFDRESADTPVPMPAVLLRTESVSSSQIEHLTANSRNLALSMLGAGGRQNAELVAANTRAMSAALALGDRVTPETILAVHRELLGAHAPQIAGRWRTEQVWIGASSTSPHGADFVPPHHERVSAAIDDLVAFAARDDMPVLLQAAIVHAQFETIHPFADGNGRTGRVLVHTVVRARGLARNVTVPISSGLLGDPGAYFRALDVYRQGNIDQITQTVAHGAIAAVANGRWLRQDMMRAREVWRTALARQPADDAARLADRLFAQPVVSRQFVAQDLGLSEPEAASSIKALRDAGVLIPLKIGRAASLWQAPDALMVLDDFAERAAKRRVL